MVIPDFSAGPRPPKIELTHESSEGPLRLARPLDRLAAAIIDICILLMPVYVLIASPLKRALTTSYILNSEADLFLGISALIAIAVVLIAAYQSLFHFFYGATAGKRILGLRVVHMFPGEELTYWDCLSRAGLWIAEAALLGLPWLAVFSNSRRRPFHDRMSDTIVVTRTPLGVYAPSPWERGLVRGVFASVLGIAALIGVIEVRGTVERMRIESAFLAVTAKDVEECAVVTDNMGELDSSDHNRLNRAMSLYAAGLADRGCLEAEVEREVAMQQPVGAVTYLAQAFVYADDAEVSNAYLDKVCEDASESVECYMSKLVGSWSEDDWLAVEEILRTAPKGSGYLEVWGVRHYMKQARYSEALALLDNLSEHRELSDFSLTQRAKALFNLYRESESQVAFQQALVALPPEEARDLGTWMCVQQLQNSCAALQTAACGQLQKGEGEDYSFDNVADTLARVMAMECRKQPANYLALSEMTPSPAWQTFFRANLKRQREDRSAAAALYAKVIQMESTPDLLRIEAARRWMQFASASQLEHLTELWTQFQSKETWMKTGNLLFNRLAESRHSDLSLRVARHLMNSGALSPKGMAQLSAMVEKAPSERKPASLKVREQVKQLLEGLEGGR